MYSNRSPPKYKKLTTGGSKYNSTNSSTAATSTATSKLLGPTSSTPLNTTASGGHPLARSSLSRSGSSMSLHSHNSSSGLLASSGHNHSHHYHHNNSNRNSNDRISVASLKRGKKHNWGTRERAGMSFLIVIAFFAVFGLIILTELFMIDERSHGGMVMLRHGGGYGGRLGDSMPDYDNVKDDYDLLDENFLGDNKLGYVQFRDNKIKVQDADNANTGRLAGILLNTGLNGFGIGGGLGVGGGLGGGSSANMPLMPWGKVLPQNVEETLPHFPVGMPPTDGSWQVVNGTRFKFFVFSAYYDGRDGARLVRVIGATKTRGPERVVCRFWYINRNVSGSGNEATRARYTSATVSARVKIIRENWNLKYSACFVLCPVRTPELEVPHYVSIVALSRTSLRAPPGNLLEVRNTDWDADFSTQRSINNASLNSSPLTALNATQTNATAFLYSSNPSAVAPGAAIPTSEQIPDKIAICVKPFHFNYDQALYLMEYLEFYSLLGVAHFTFYNHTIGPHATCVLQHYMDGDIPGNLTATDVDEAAGEQAANYKDEAAPSSSFNASATKNPPKPLTSRQKHHMEMPKYTKPTINILPWNLRMRSQKEIRTEGLFAALNDCLYRSMYRYKYLALVDLDEFIVPRHNDTLNELINSLNRRFRNRNMGAYSFQNAFFYLQFPDESWLAQDVEMPSNALLRAALVTQRKTRRRFKLHPQKQRSKYICKPESVVEAGNHFVWEFSPGKGSLNVPPTEAILQHYRVCEFGGNDCIKAPSVVDRTATKYVNRLVQRVDLVYKHLKKRCDLPDLPAFPNQQLKEAKEQFFKSKEEPMKVNNEFEETNKNSKVPDVAKPKNNGDVTTKVTLVGAKPSKETNFFAKTTTKTTLKQNTSTTTKATPKSKPVTIATTKVNNAQVNGDIPPIESNVKFDGFSRKRKMIVFETGNDGSPVARVEFV